MVLKCIFYFDFIKVRIIFFVGLYLKRILCFELFINDFKKKKKIYIYIYVCGFENRKILLK
jgi:hypothetical protein